MSSVSQAAGDVESLDMCASAPHYRAFHTTSPNKERPMVRRWLACLFGVAMLAASVAAQQTASVTRASLLRKSPINAQAPLARLQPGASVTLLATAKRQGYYRVPTAHGV